MKAKLLSILFLSQFLMSIFSQNVFAFKRESSTDTSAQINGASLNDTNRIVTFYKKLVFKINNQDIKQIGYQAYDEDESIGVKGLCVDGDNVFITDVYHSNVKKISITSGEMGSSPACLMKQQDDHFSRSWFRDIGIFNGKIFVTTDRDSIFVFSKNLKLLQSIPVEKGDKYIYSIDRDKIFIYLSDRQLVDYSVLYHLLSVNDKGEIQNEEKTVSIKHYEHQNKKSEVYNREYRQYSKNGKNYFQSQYGTIELKEAIPHIDSYDAHNVNFNQSTLVYFNATANEFILYIYKW